VGGEGVELDLVGVHPEPQHLALVAHHAVDRGPRDGDDHVVGPLGRAAAFRIGLDIAEKAQRLAVKARGDGDVGVGDDRHQPFGAGAADRRGNQQQGERQAPHMMPPRPSTAMLKGSDGASTSASPKRTATASTSAASRNRNCSPLRYCPAAAPNCAPIVPPTMRQKASSRSTLWLCSDCSTMVEAIVASTCSSVVPTTMLPGTRSRYTSAGTTMKPPPMPSSEPTKPMNTPIARIGSTLT